MILKPWVKTAYKTLIIGLVVAFIFSVAFSIYQLSHRLEILEKQPVVVNTTVVQPTATPTATPSATIAPVRVRPVVTVVPTASQ